ncbi:MAG: hypothetical protein AB7P23_02135 [Amphiplicatus sp.]
MNESRDERPEAPFSAPFGAALSAPGGFSHFAEAVGARNLLLIIVTMPLVFLLVVMATIAVFGSPADRKKEAARQDVLSQPVQHYVGALAEETRGARALGATQASMPTPSLAPLVLPREAKIGAMALDGDRLALRVEGENGGEIVIYDLARGATVQRIAVTPQQIVGEGL